MSEARSILTSGTLQAWSRLPLSIRLGLVIVVVAGASLMATAAIERPSNVPAAAHAAVLAAPARDPSVPEAGPALSREDRQPDVWTPTF